LEYFTIPELPDVQMFSCERHKATLRVDACKGMWLEANGRTPPERLAKCRNCPFGARHAGFETFHVSTLKGSGICSRCHRTGMRLVRGDICVSCWNREREFLIGKNAKGRPPKLHPDVALRTIRFRNGDQIDRIKREHSVSLEELMVAALRDSHRQVFFGFNAGPPPAMSVPIQGELF
jgi:hypothetical protein